MFRTFAFALTLVATNTSLAQTTTYNPKIAYAQVSGTTQYLYLANDDGTRAVRVATVPRDINGFPGNIKGVDLSPAGNKVAFADSQGLKLVSYNATNSGIQVNGVQLLVAGASVASPDFSPDGSRIIYQTSSNSAPNTVRVVTVPGGVEVLAYSCYSCSEPRWLRSEVGEAFAFRRWNYSGPSPIPEIWTALVNADSTVTAGPVLSTTTQAFKGIEDFDVARTRNSLLITANYPTTIRLVEFDIVTGAVVDKGGPGFRAHYSSDDSRIVFLDLNRSYVNSLNPSNGVITRLTKKGSFGVTDARP